MMKLWFITVSLLSISCQQPPQYNRASKQTAQEAANENTFNEFLTKADLLETEEDKEKFVALLNEFQVLQRDTSTITGSLAGRCIVLMTGETPLKQQDIKDASIRLSPNARIAYSSASTLTPDSCQGYFLSGLSDRYAADFFKAHVSLFAFY